MLEYAPIVCLSLAVAAVSLPAMGQTSPTPPTTQQMTTQATAADVPVRRVSLFSSGVGFFEHAGTVREQAEATLSFKTEQVNDVLKSLVLQDLDGGTVSSVSYQSQDPLDHALRGFQIDLSGEPAIWQILQQLRGAQVSVTTSGNQFAGTILGVEPRKKAVGDKAVLEVATLNLITAGGIKSVAIEEATNIVLADPKLQEELTKALAAVAAARDADKKQVTVHFGGTGERRVRLGYVVETPIWKASYRLMIGEDAKKSDLQGWAIVENQTDSDWNDIDLSLVSGRPMSFRMDLYQPLYLPRPEAKLELFAGLTPQTYAEAREMQLEAPAAPAAAAPMEAKQSRARRVGGSLFGGGGAGGRATESLAADTAGYAAVTSVASAGTIGELFQYTIPDVTVARQSSAMVPIVTEPVEVAPVSIFNSTVLARYPLNGARVKNTTDKHLLQGPITVFQGGGYAGDAQVNNVPPGQTRLISFGVDLQTLVDADKVDQSSEIIGVKIVKGTIEATSRTVQARHYQLSNKGTKPKLVAIEHPKLGGGWALVDTEKPVETTDALYRFDRPLEPGKAEDFIVRQQLVNAQLIAMTSASVDQLIYFTKHGATPAKVKEAIGKALSMKQEQAALDRQIAETQAKLDEITKEQTRIRENLKTVDKASAYYGRLMKKLDEQETEIDALQTKLKETTKARDAKRAELEDYLNTLSVE